MWKNGNNVKKFTDVLENLVVMQKIPLPNALNIMSKNRKKGSTNGQISKAANEILEELKNGEDFSHALKVNSFIDFDQSYITFIRFSEKTGNLIETISFLKKRCSRVEENIQKIIGTIIYPIFVILLAIIAVIFLSGYCNNLYSGEQSNNLLNVDLINSSGKAFGFLFIFSCFGFYFIKKNLGNDKLYEAFLAADFLVKNGESFSSAIEISAEILGDKTKEGKMFLSAKEKMEFGIDLKNAFLIGNSKKWDEIQEAFFYAENAGGKTEVFEKIATKLFLDMERRRNICLRLIEPLFIAGTGIFLMLFLMDTTLPLLSGEMFGII